MTQDSHPKRRTFLRWLPGILISVIALIAVFKFIDFEDLKIAFTTIEPKFFILIFLIDILGLGIRGKAWQTILGDKVTVKQAFFGVSEGYFLNNILPFRAGEIGRSFFLGRNSGLGTFYVLSTIVIERAFDILFAAVLVVITLPYLVGMDWIRPIATIALILVLAGGILLFLVAKNKEKVLSWLNHVEKPSKFIKFLIPKTQSIIEGFSSVAKPSRFFLSLFWIGVCWVVWSSVYYFAVNAILPGAPLWWGAFVSSVLALGVAIPSAPSAIGVYEASFVGALAIIGGPSSIALAYAIILHFIQFLVSGIFGIWGLAREGMSISQLINSINRSSIEPNSNDSFKETG
jgi:uncharacterized protein (TIRG00374 family)